MSEVDHLHHSNFDFQIQQVRHVESFGGTAGYVDIRPEICSDETPILIASGFGETPDSLRETARVVYEHGRRVIVVQHARQGGPPETEPGWRAELAQKTGTLLTILEAAGVRRCDIIAHSEGALHACCAALKEPRRVRSIILAMPAGMIGEDSIIALAKRFSVAIAHGQSRDMRDNPPIARAVDKSVSSHVARNIPKSYREALSIANVTIDEFLGELRERGVKIGLLQAQSDPVFPPDRIAAHVMAGEGGAAGLRVDSWASVAAWRAGHNDLLINPHRAATAALQMLDGLNHPFPNSHRTAAR